MNGFLLWIAQGFGVGRISFAPGTLGSILGLLWFALLLLTQNIWFFLAGTLAGLAFSIWICGVGERIFGRKDPGSVVMDEITAMPVCFLGWLVMTVWRTDSLPAPDYFLSAQNWPLTLGVFVVFRCCDIFKPWPARQSQSLPGGWGITVDDVLAAVHVNVVVLAAFAARALICK